MSNRFPETMADLSARSMTRAAQKANNNEELLAIMHILAAINFNMAAIANSLEIISDHLTGAEQKDTDAMNNKFNTVEPDEK